MQDLSQLKDIHLPPAITEWPIAYGWWLSLALLIAIIAVSVLLFIKQRKKSAIKRSALTLLDHQYTQFKANKDAQVFLQQCNQVLKRYCLSHYPEAVSLSGAAWINFLIRHSQKAFFAEDVAHAISQGIYQENCQYNAEELYTSCSNWLKNNKSLVIESNTGDSND